MLQIHVVLWIWKSLETVFLIAIFRKSGDKSQSKNRATNGNLKPCFKRFLSTFVDSINVFDCRLSGVKLFKNILKIYNSSLMTNEPRHVISNNVAF